jgi:hypothetical protein
MMEWGLSRDEIVEFVKNILYAKAFDIEDPKILEEELITFVDSSFMKLTGKKKCSI